MLGGEYWEGYGKCSVSDLPAGIRFDVSPLHSKRYEVAFGGPRDHGAPYDWGAPYRRIVDRQHWTVVFSRYRRVSPPQHRWEE